MDIFPVIRASEAAAACGAAAAVAATASAAAHASTAAARQAAMVPGGGGDATSPEVPHPEVPHAEVPHPQHPQVLHPEILHPEILHPALWRASQLGRAAASGLATGFGALDAELPGGGWPRQALTELLLPHPGVGEWRLLAPVLAALQRGAGPDLPRSVMLFDPPARPCAWTLSALGLDLALIVVVQGRAQPRGRGRLGSALPGLDTLWALEQALSSGQVGAVLAWLPTRLRGDALRRLQLAAQAHPGPAFLFREVEARLKPSAAPLRLQLAAGQPDQLLLRVLKRRGPPRSDPLALALPPVLSASARERALAPRRPPVPAPLPVPVNALAWVSDAASMATAGSPDAPARP